jgi:hypothetical protein
MSTMFASSKGGTVYRPSTYIPGSTGTHVWILLSYLFSGSAPGSVARQPWIPKTLMLGLGFCALAAAQTAGPPAGSPEYLAAWLPHIAAELRQLHLELLEDRQDILQAKLKDLGLELQIIHSQQQQEQRTHVQELAEIEAQLSLSTLSESERNDLDNRRTELLASPDKLTNPQSTLTQRETQLRERLSLLQQRLQLLTQRAQELAPGR